MFSGMLFVKFLLLVVTVCKEATSIRFQYLGVPGSVLLGEEVWLDCGYDLEDDELYSVKWYKDNYEFYRYLPSDSPPSQKYNMHGIFTELQNSNATHVFLTRTDLDSEGTYACEVSTDAPSFRTVRAEKEMRIYVMPEVDPLIVGVLNRYAVDDFVNVTCFFGPSKPPAELMWYINGEPVPESSASYGRSYVGEEEMDLASVESQLQFVVNPSHLLHGAINLECTASVSQVFSKSSKEIVVGDTTSAVDFQRITQIAPGEEPPTITGSMTAYEVGQLVDVNCTSARSEEPAELQWEINEEQANPDFLVHRRPIIYPDGRVSTQLGLRFRLSDEHFKGGEMRIKCIATLSHVVERTAIETIYSGEHGSSGMFHVSGSACSSYLCLGRSQCYLFLLLFVQAVLTFR